MYLTLDWTTLLVVVFIASIFLADGMRRQWRDNEWKRRLRPARLRDIDANQAGAFDRRLDQP
jgi:hypothetical protein